ncbi:GNAT family N-acetyltransferase [Alcaligenaceae bacterium B3P038]|nr:GNAT family N-acetyltransferase [Alcaligenaceae bacterium B3P038]
MPSLTAPTARVAALDYQPVQATDFEDLLSLRIAAMRESLEAIGRFDLARARSRLAATFKPEQTFWIVDCDRETAHTRIGFYAVQAEPDHLMLQHLYLHPTASGRGLGAHVMQRLIDASEQAKLPLRVCALRDSRSNGFYAAQGFVKTGEGEWDIEYERPLSNQQQA